MDYLHGLFIHTGGLLPETSRALTSKGKKAKSKTTAAEADDTRSHEGASTETIRVILAFKRYMYDPKKQMLQT